MYRIGLNARARENYAFFCPESRLHLTRSNPVGTIDRVTSSILRGLKAKTLIDVDGTIDLDGKKETLKVEPKVEAKVEEPKKEVKVEEPKVEVKEEVKTEEPKEAPAKKSRKKSEE